MAILAFQKPEKTLLVDKFKTLAHQDPAKAYGLLSEWSWTKAMSGEAKEFVTEMSDHVFDGCVAVNTPETLGLAYELTAWRIKWDGDGEAYALRARNSEVQEMFENLNAPISFDEARVAALKKQGTLPIEVWRMRIDDKFRAFLNNDIVGSDAVSTKIKANEPING